MLIKIFGGKSEGKSTVAKLIEKVLRENGIEVELLEEQASPDWEHNLTKIRDAGAAGDPLKVEIKTILYARETLPAYATHFNKNASNKTGKE